MHKDLLKLLEDKEVLYLLQDLKRAEELKDNIKINIYIKKGKIKDKEYIRKQYNGK